MTRKKEKGRKRRGRGGREKEGKKEKGNMAKWISRTDGAMPSRTGLTRSGIPVEKVNLFCFIFYSFKHFISDIFLSFLHFPFLDFKPRNI
jgi:hypothetical protein